MTTQTDKGDSRNDDSKDFVEQLRLIHFTLVATCLAMMVISFSPQPTLLQTAREQLRQISEMSQAGVWDPRFYGNVKKNSVKKSGKDWGDAAFPVCPQSTSTTNGIEVLGQQFKMPTQKFALLRMRSPDVAEKVVDAKAPETLEQFQKIWDADGDLLCPNQVTEQAFLTNPLRKTALKPLSDVKQPLTALFCDLEFNSDLPEKLQDFPEDDVFFLCQWKNSSLILPVSTTAVPLDFQSELRQLAKQPNWRHGDFKDAFYELHEATPFVQGLRYKELDSVLMLQEQKAKENFEAFGIKFPAQGATKWGIFLILSIQLYFWLHITEYRRRNFPKTNVAWIGAYPHVFARFVFFITAVIAPILVVVLLLFFQRDLVMRRGLADCAVGMSGILAALSWHAHRGSNLSGRESTHEESVHEAQTAAKGGV